MQYPNNKRKSRIQRGIRSIPCQHLTNFRKHTQREKGERERGGARINHQERKTQEASNQPDLMKI
jgi:hypothetical protein